MSLISIGKAAKIFGVSRDTLRNWEQQGKIKSIRTKGNHRRYDESDIKQCKIIDFMSKVSSSSKDCNEWYDFYCINEPVISMASYYAAQRIDNELDRLKFIIAVVGREKSESLTEQWSRNNEL